MTERKETIKERADRILKEKQDSQKSSQKVENAQQSHDTVDLLNKAEKITKKPKGGKREGAGRPPGGAALHKRIERQIIEDLLNEQGVFQTRDPKTGKTVTIHKPILGIAIRKMYQIGMNKDDASALDRFINRLVGKPKQPIVGGDEEEPVRIDLGVDNILRKAYGNGNKRPDRA